MDNFPELEKAIEEVAFLLENFDFATHNDEANPEHVESAQRALEDLRGAVGDLVP